MKSVSTQEVGGLLFDVDEGVKIEKGPGGSINVKSNREYMQEKFNSIDEKFKSIDERLRTIEERLYKLETKPAQRRTVTLQQADSAAVETETSAGARVFSTQ